MANETEKKKKRRSPVRWFKELGSEIRKVTWPTFPTVLKQLSVVLVVTLAFLLVLMGMDALLGYLFKLLKTGLEAGTGTASAVALNAVTDAVGAVFRL